MATVFFAVVTGVLVVQQFLECAFAGTVFSCCRGGGRRYLRLLARCWLGLGGLLRDCGRGLGFWGLWLSVWDLLCRFRLRCVVLTGCAAA